MLSEAMFDGGVKKGLAGMLHEEVRMVLGGISAEYLSYTCSKIFWGIRSPSEPGFEFNKR